MNQRDFVRSKKEEVLQHLKNGYSVPDIAEILLNTYDYKVNSVKSFTRATREVVYEFEDLLKEQEVKEVEQKVEEYVEDYEESVIDELEYQHKYYYSKDSDQYFFFISNPPIVITGDLVRQLKTEYSNMTGPASSINEICRKYRITRKIFVKIKTILGWTHDDDPFTLEELKEDSFDIDGAVESMILQKKNELSKRFNREDLRVMSRAARKWWRFQENLVNPFVDSLIEKMKEGYSSGDVLFINPKDYVSESEDSYACVLAPFDLHYGKYASKLEVGDGLEYDKKIAKEVLFKSTQNVLNKIKKHNIDKFIVPIGSDFFHVDNPRHTTTAGTPQDMDGTFIEMASEGNKIMIQFIDTLRQIAPVEVYLCAGNHDFSMSHQLLEVLTAWYRTENDVTVDNQRKDRTYAQYGDCMLGFTHGDGAKYKDLPNLMMRDNKKMFALTNFHAMFHGHLHHEILRDVQGVKVYQMPSLSGSDRWHHKKGYEYSIRGLVAYMVHPERGVEMNILDNIV